MTIAKVKAFVECATEGEIAFIIQACLGELGVRKENARKKEQWVDKMYRAYLSHPNASDRREGNMTIVALYERNSGTKIGIAKCSPTDTFSEKTGLAVGYARAIGAHIPNYI